MILRTATGGLRMAFSPNSISRDSHNGTPATAVRFGSHPALPVGQCLVGQKGFQDVPYSDIYDVAADCYFFHGQSFRSAISRAM